MIRNLKLNKKKLRGIIFAISLTVPVGIFSCAKIKEDEKDKIIINAKNETTLYQLSKKLDYDYEDLKDLNDNIDSYIREGQEIVIRLSDLEKDEFTNYKIKKDDTLSKIAEKYGISTESLVKIDERLESDEELKHHVGEKISIYKMNAPRIQTMEYIVQKGDSLIGITEKINKEIENDISVESLCEENNLEGENIIYPNQKLKITVEATDYQINKILKNNKIQKQEQKKPEIITSAKETTKKYGSLRGIDISEYNQKIDWKKLAKSKEIDFVIIRMFDGYNMEYNKKSSDKTEGRLNKIDEKFFENVEMCEKYNIPYGIYTYSRATTEKMAEIEAKKIISILAKGNIRPTYPIYYDIESQVSQNLKTEKGKSISSVDFINNNPAQVIANYKAYAKVLEDNNYYCGIYTNESAINKIDPTGEKLKQYTVWYSRYTGLENSFKDHTVMKDGYKGEIGMYQFSSRGRVTGVTGYVDCNYCKYDYSKVIKKLGMNKPVKQEKPKQKKKTHK